MSFRSFVLAQLQRRYSDARLPNFVVGGAQEPYLLRWYVIPRNRFLNVYFHRFLRSDEDRALHDHPWYSLSWILEGGYYEHLQDGKHWRPEGYVGWRRGTGLHRVELVNDRHWQEAKDDYGTYRLPDVIKPRPAWTLFITGPKYRDWGFACPQGWIPWQRFTKPGHKGEIGPGCDG